MSSLRGKILTTYGFSKAVLLIFAGVVFADLYYLQTQILAGESVHAFREASQEIRREEKNLFLYHEMSNIKEVFVQLDAANAALDDGQQAFAEIATTEELEQVDHLLQLYRVQFKQYSALELEARTDRQQDIRTLGRELSDLAESFSRRERNELANAVQTAGTTLLVTFLTVVILGIGSALFMIRQVVRPLRKLEEQLDKLADGHDEQLTLPSKDQEIKSFVHHFNAMLNRTRVQQNQLRHHEKAAALGVLVSGVAHELNNPLSNISTSVQLLMEDDGSVDPELSRQWLSHIDGESERARRIVRRLLDSVRQPKTRRQEHNIYDLIQASLALVKRQLPSSVAVHFGASPERTVWADRERIHQVFINLLKNAADAGATQITINAFETTWNASMPTNTDHLVGDISPVSHATSLLLIQIDDNGPGIAPAHMAQIFDPFFTTHAAGDGTGLGLYLVEEIICEHYGCIAAENRTDGGTRFSIWLPLGQMQESA